MDINKNTLLIITKNPLFAGMDSGQAEKAVSLLDGTVSAYKKGEFVHSPYKKLNAFGLVLSGTVQACTDDFGGNKIIMAQVLPGSTFGESLCFLQTENSPVYIVAPENAEILWLSPKRLFCGETGSDISELQKRFSSLLAARTLAMNNRIQILSKLTIREKLTVFFTETALSSGKNEFTVEMSREDMATYIGADRAAMCREMSKMKNDGIIDYSGHNFKLIKNN